MTPPSWRQTLLRRVGWSFAASTLWTWGLLLIRMLRDGWQPLEVWFSYSLSFFMTAVYAYLGLTIAATIRAEGGQSPTEGSSGEAGRAGRVLARYRRPAAALGVLGALTALISLVLWLALRYPGPQALPGTVASALLAAMVLAVVAVSTLVARGAR